VDTSNTLKHKSVQTVGYADDINNLGGRWRYIRGRLEELEIARENCRLS
jgi:hypothetical protein